MTDKAKIEKIVLEFIKGKGVFLVAVRVSSTGKITVLVDRKEGITIKECAELSRFIGKILESESEDYELQVSSPGIDMPFLVKEQYYKNEGRSVEVIGSDGEKHTGVLKNVTDGGFELESQIIIKSAGKKRSVEIRDISFNYEQVKSAREIVTF